MLKESLTVKHNISLSIQFVNGVTQELEADGKTVFKRNVKKDFSNIADYKLFAINKEQQKYEQTKHDVQAKINRKNQIEHYFNVVDRQLQFVMKKKNVCTFCYTKTNLYLSYYFPTYLLNILLLGARRYLYIILYNNMDL